MEVQNGPKLEQNGPKLEQIGVKTQNHNFFKYYEVPEDLKLHQMVYNLEI